MNSYEVNVDNQTWQLLPEKAIYWKEKKTLILSDVHLGKSGHFRKSGIPAPPDLNEENQTRMKLLIENHKPERLLILGDLFHSCANREWFRFEEWRSQFSDLHIHLIKGNHDSLHDSFYAQADLKVTEWLREDGFCFVHHPTAEYQTDEILVGGHVHPGIKLSGKGRQALRLPCFFFSDATIILPAFGTFTGLHLIDIDDASGIYAIVDNSVIAIKP